MKIMMNKPQHCLRQQLIILIIISVYNIQPSIYIYSLTQTNKMRLILTFQTAVILSVVLGSTAVSSKSLVQPLNSNNKHFQGEQVVENYTITIQQFKTKYGKRYSSKRQQQYRAFLIKINLQIINKHNSNPNKSYTMKPNMFLDMQRKEFQSIYSNSSKAYYQSRNSSHRYIRKKERNNVEFNQTKIEKAKKLQGTSIQGKNIRNGTNKAKKHIFLQKERNQNANNLSQSTTTRKRGRNRNLQAIIDQYIKNSNSSLPQIKPLIDLKQQVNNNQKQDNNANLFIDWTLYSGKVNYQGVCGACYAFSTIDALSAAYAIQKNGFYTQLSYQQIVDCAHSGQYFGGCLGGFLEGAYHYMQTKGVTLDYVYPYTNQQRFTAGECKVQGGSFKIDSFDQIEEGDCSHILEQLKKGPVSVGIAGFNLQHYSSGVFDGCHDEPEDHAVLIVGYDSKKGWKIKNSWSDQWGQNGYAWISPGNTCRICNRAILFTL